MYVDAPTELFYFYCLKGTPMNLFNNVALSAQFDQMEFFFVGDELQSRGIQYTLTTLWGKNCSPQA